MLILAIDPGNTKSGYCLISDLTLMPVEHGKIYNLELLPIIEAHAEQGCPLVIERIASYGMAVGREVFETCEWIGRFIQRFLDFGGVIVFTVFRKDEKLHICGDPRAKDANIRRALIDRFAKHDLKNGKGTKDNPDWFYGFKADEWAAYAAGITAIETPCRCF